MHARTHARMHAHTHTQMHTHRPEPEASHPKMMLSRGVVTYSLSSTRTGDGKRMP